MIYKIYNIQTSQELEKIIEKFSEKALFLYYKDTVFIANAMFQNKQKNQDFFIEGKLKYSLITEENLLDEDPVVVNWCKEKFVELEKEQYENDKQQKLRQVWMAMDALEQDLKKIKEEKRNNVNK